ncbi:DUF664 domain-containing protein [Microbacterium sp. CFBP9034]|uniref:mycothiol transferase n=1 Tax=Microbacterium sp. CFBP9034 TaxID=3096540 RepID=UPI002A6B5975|nr:DUF664 domain-containing protein [Microbacterium sp. CFBP9034]MDY0908784.1 DUF664 domain-containing protein [Microbacterium sp. CFBP9034]
MMSDPLNGSGTLTLVSRLAAALPSLSPTELEELADAVEALTDAIGLQRDWPANRASPAEPTVGKAPTPLLTGVDLSRWSEPDDTGDERADLVAWLEYQRHEFLRKLRDLSAEQARQWSVPPVELSVVGLVRHMRQMEAGYLGWGLTGDGEQDFYGDDDYTGGSLDSVGDDVRGWLAEMERADAAIGASSSLDARGLGHGRTLRWSLLKMVHEYALHAGEAHMIRFAALGEMRR